MKKGNFVHKINTNSYIYYVIIIITIPIFLSEAHRKMKNAKTNKNIKTAYKILLVAVGVFYALYVATVPIFSVVNSNVSYMDTVLPNLLNFLGKVFEVCGIALIYAIALFSVYKNGSAAYGVSFAICSVSALIKCAVAQVIYWVVNGGIPALNNGLIEEALWTVILPSALEVIQFTVFFLIARGGILKYREAYFEARTSAGGGNYPDMDSWVYPFKKLIDVKNPLLYGCLVGGGVILVSKILLSLRAELDMLINGLFIKTLPDLIDAVAVYASDIACGVLAYTVMVFAIIKAFELKDKNKITK